MRNPMATPALGEHSHAKKERKKERKTERNLNGSETEDFLRMNSCGIGWERKLVTQNVTDVRKSVITRNQ